MGKYNLSRQNKKGGIFSPGAIPGCQPAPSAAGELKGLADWFSPSPFRRPAITSAFALWWALELEEG